MSQCLLEKLFVLGWVDSAIDAQAERNGKAPNSSFHLHFFETNFVFPARPIGARTLHVKAVVAHRYFSNNLPVLINYFQVAVTNVCVICQHVCNHNQIVNCWQENILHNFYGVFIFSNGDRALKVIVGAVACVVDLPH